MNRIPCHWDCEVYSEAPLQKVGMFKYAEHASTEMLCCAYAIGNSDPVLWLPGDEPPPFVKEPDKYQLWCHNALFEWCIWQHVMADKWGTPPSIENWTCTAAMAAALALPRSLGAACEAVGLPIDQQKGKRGKYLIQRLCKPNRGKRIQDQELLNELYLYNNQDVIAERALSERLLPLNSLERKVWELDQTVNIRGVFIDTQAVDDALIIIDQVAEYLNGEVSRITDGELVNVSQRQRVIDYIGSLGFVMEKFDKAYLEVVLKDESLPDIARRLIEIRQQLGKTSTAKYTALKELVTDDHRAHGLLMYHGAATGRWSGKHFQPQNLPRGSVKDIESCIELFKHRDSALLEMLFDDPMEALSSCLRGMISSPKGKQLYVCDLASIEARVLAWLAGQEDILEVFRSHGKIYEYTTSKIYCKPVESVTKSERFIGKTATLALGYAGGAKAFQNMADVYGINIDTELAEQIKTDWRKANKKIVSYWYNIESAAIKATEKPGTTHTVRNVAFRVVGDFLHARLPSGRALSYFKPKITIGKFDRPQVTFMGTNSMTRKWERQSAYSGKLVENLTQAVARDILAEAMLRIEKAGYEIVLSVHDEVIAEAPEKFGSSEHFESLMCVQPDWAEGLPLAAEGFTAKRYRK